MFKYQRVYIPYIPICSMFGIFANIYHINDPNVGKHMQTFPNMEHLVIPGLVTLYRVIPQVFKFDTPGLTLGQCILCVAML